jgi:glucose/arabinose dehydrogenase
MLAFGPDHYLYIGVGDGGSGNDPPNNAQNLDVLLGKILRGRSPGSPRPIRARMRSRRPKRRSPRRAAPAASP